MICMVIISLTSKFMRTTAPENGWHKGIFHWSFYQVNRPSMHNFHLCTFDRKNAFQVFWTNISLWDLSNRLSTLCIDMAWTEARFEGLFVVSSGFTQTCCCNGSFLSQWMFSTALSTSIWTVAQSPPLLNLTLAWQLHSLTKGSANYRST